MNFCALFLAGLLALPAPSFAVTRASEAANEAVYSFVEKTWAKAREEAGHVKLFERPGPDSVWQKIVQAIKHERMYPRAELELHVNKDDPVFDPKVGYSETAIHRKREIAIASMNSATGPILDLVKVELIDGGYEVVDGRHTLRIAKELGIEFVPMRVTGDRRTHR